MSWPHIRAPDAPRSPNTATLPAASRPRLPFLLPPKLVPAQAGIAFINLYLAAENLRRFRRQAFKYHLAQLVIKQGRRIAIDPGQLCRRARRNACTKIRQSAAFECLHGACSAAFF